jgi:16S rRNA (adenine1518-N6/adenine1519-N6)-dimethyltransferase
MHLKHKKRLGQNFLSDRNILTKIVDSSELNPADIVLEIGSGCGELTKMIAERVFKVYAVEIDTALCNGLLENIKGIPNIEVINKDVLKLDFKGLFKKAQRKLKDCTIKVIGNIPYYISSPIIEYLFGFRYAIDSIFITVQKEFARRMVAPSGSRVYGSFSCFVQYYAQAKILFDISKNCFFPRPEVDSSFLRLEIKKELPLDNSEERLLFRIIRAAFNQRRKTLRNSLTGIVGSQKLLSFFSIYGIDKNTRPEDLSLSDFIALSKI